MKKFLPVITAALFFVGMFAVPHSAQAALQYVGGVTGSHAGSTSAGITLSLTGLTGGISSSAAAGDIVIVVITSGSTAQRSIGVSSAGYTSLGNMFVAGPSFDTNFSVNWKIMGGTPDTSVVTTSSGNNSEAITATVQVWRGVDTGTPFDVASTSAQGTGIATPTPPPITPITPGAVIIATGGSAAATQAVFTSSSLSNFISATQADTDDSTTGMGSFAWTSGTYTPSQFSGGSGQTTANSWAAITMALRPLVSAPTVTTNAATSITSSSATLPGSITNTGGANATQTGFALSTNSTLVSGVSTSTLGSFSGTGTFTGSASSLTANTTYYYRAYATNSAGTGYGSIQSFTTCASGGCAGTPPSRHIRLFEGFKIKIFNGAKLKIYQL